MVVGMVVADKYELLGELPASGSYKVRHVLLDTIFALRYLPDHLTADPARLSHFRRTVRTLFRYQHENIVRVLDVGRDGNRYFVVEEFVDGVPLGQHLTGRDPLTLDETVEIACQLARGLGHAHEHGLIHGDVNPSALLIQGDGPLCAKLTDFGLAGPGALPYAAPEREHGDGLDVRADVYSLGLVLFEMATGRPHESVVRRLVGDSAPLELLATDRVPPAVSAVVARATRIDPSERHASMQELLRDLELRTNRTAALVRDLTDEIPEPAVVAPFPVTSSAVPVASPVLPAVQARTVEVVPDDEPIVGVDVTPEEAARDAEPSAAPPVDAAAVEELALTDAPIAGVPVAAVPVAGASADGPIAWPATVSARSRAALVRGGLAALVLLAAASWVLRPHALDPPPLTTSAPPNVPPLAWREITPALAETSIAAGEHLSFGATVADADRHENLVVAWSLDGREQARGTSWELVPSADDGGRTHDVSVVASSTHAWIEQHWRVHVAAGVRASAIVTRSPATDAVSLLVGADQQFSVAPDADAGDTLVYTWERNGKVVASGSTGSWTLRGATDGDASVRVTVADGTGERLDTATWRLEVAGRTPSQPGKNTPPRVARKVPAAPSISVADGSTVEFTVRASDADPDDRLTYAWQVDGRATARTPTLRWTAPPPADGGVHTIAVQVADRGGLTAPAVAWMVSVTPRMTDVDVRGWLTRYQGAWERKDTATLRLFGVVTNDAQSAALEKTLARYEGYKVALSGATIRTTGAQATVSFDRTETGSGGKTLAKTHESLELEKHPSGLITIRAAH
jgi:serine/threonine-protein kinase